MTAVATGEVGPEPFEDLLVLDLLDRTATGDHLVGSRCPRCGHLQLGKRAMCSACPSTEVDNVNLGSEGTLYSWTTMHVGPRAPQTFAWVDLLDGVRILAILDDSVHPRIGMELRLSVTADSWVFTRTENRSVA